MCVQNLTLRPSLCPRLPHAVPRAGLFAPVPFLHPPHFMFTYTSVSPPSSQQLLPGKHCFLFSLLPELGYMVPNFYCQAPLWELEWTISQAVLTTALGHRCQVHSDVTEEDPTEKTDLQRR